MVTITNATDGSSITVYQQGGHITSWKTAEGEEHLYNSPKSVYADGKAIRGGVPLIFPQFSDLGPLPVSHGFLRVSPFEVRKSEPKGATGMQEVQFVYQLRPGVQNLLPNAEVDVLLTVTFNAFHLHMDVAVTNLSSDAFEFAFAFHTYFSVDTKKTEVGGLNDTSYLDDLQDRKPCPAAPVKHFTEEIDRIYVNQKEKPVTLTFPTANGRKKTLRMRTDNFKDVVLWNPWIEKTKQMKDLPEDGYLHFVCVEHGTILEKEKLAPKGGTWHAAQIVDVMYDVSPSL